jgi:PAS domain S-box-containing protein
VSLRLRLTLILSVLIGLFTLVTARIVVDDARRSIREEMEAGTKVTLQLLTTVLSASDLGQRNGRPDGHLLVFLQNLGRVRAQEISFFDEQDRLAYTSPPSVYKAGRSAPDWFVRLVAPELPPIELKAGTGRLVVTPDASRAVLDAWDDMRGFLWLALGFLVALNSTVFLLLGRALRPIKTVLAGLSEMERGRFDVRLPAFRSSEFDSIGHTFNRMADALEESHAENRRLALVAKQSSDAIIIHDLQGNISFWNPAAERLFGYPAEEIVGKSATLLTPADREHEVAESLQAVRERRMIDTVETQRCARDGRVIEVALSAAPMVDPASGEVIGEICSMRDITERKRAQEAARELEQNRRLTQLIQTRLEEERRTIARELHDELGQCLTAIKTIGTAIANRSQQDAPETHRNAQTIVQVTSHIYDVVHGIIRQLRPSALDHLGLRDALEDWVATWRQRYPEIQCELALSGDLSDLGETVNITVYRIIQECLTNVVRHAAATRADLSVKRLGDVVEVTVEDNGKGLGERSQSDSARFGLMGMRERVQALHGSFAIESDAGAGVRVRATLPVAA